MRTIEPDFARLKKILLREGLPDYIPPFELYVDSEVEYKVTGKTGMEGHAGFFRGMGFCHITAGTGLNYRLKTIPTADGSRHFVDENSGPISNRRDFDAFPWPKAEPSAAARVNEARKYLPKGMKIIVSTSNGLFENMMSLMGCVPFSFALYDDLQLVLDIFEIIGKNYADTLRICLDNTDISDIGAVDLSDDMGYNGGTMIAPEFLRKYVLPWHKKAADIAHGYGLPVIMHSCGRLDAIMDDLIDTVGIDAKHSFEDGIQPVWESKEKYGGRIALLGGVDVGNLCLMKEEELRLYVRKIMDACIPGGGFAPGSGNSLAGYIPFENYKIMLDECRRYNGM